MIISIVTWIISIIVPSLSLSGCFLSKLENDLDHLVRRISLSSPLLKFNDGPILFLLLQRRLLLETLWTTVFQLFDAPVNLLLRRAHPPLLQALRTAEAGSHGSEADDEEEEDEEEEEDAGDGVHDGGSGGVGD